MTKEKYKPVPWVSAIIKLNPTTNKVTLTLSPIKKVSPVRYTHVMDLREFQAFDLTNAIKGPGDEALCREVTDGVCVLYLLGCNNKAVWTLPASEWDDVLHQVNKQLNRAAQMDKNVKALVFNKGLPEKFFDCLPDDISTLSLGDIVGAGRYLKLRDKA